MQRKPLPDLIKGFAVVFMIQVHIMELFARPEVYDSAVGRISLFLGGPFAAPVFLAVMGYFLAASRRTTKSLVWRGLKLLSLGLALNIGLNLHLLIKIFSGAISENPWKYVFGADILFVAGLSIIAISFLQKIFKKDVIFYILLMLILPVVVLFLPESTDQNNFHTYLTTFLWMKTSWSYFPFIPWFSYPLLGYSFFLIEKDYSFPLSAIRKKKPFILSALIIVLGLTSVYPFRIITHLPLYYHHGILTFLWISGFIVLLGLILEMVQQEWGNSSLIRYIRWLGIRVTEVYVIQWLIIGNMATAIYKTQYLFWLFFWFAGILAASSILTYIYRRLYER